MNSSRTSRRPPLRSGFGGDALPEDGKGLCKLIAASKTSGTLNLSNRQLEEVGLPVDSWGLHLGHMTAQAGATSILWVMTGCLVSVQVPTDVFQLPADDDNVKWWEVRVLLSSTGWL